MYIYILYLYSLLFTGKCRFIIMISLVKAAEENKRRKKKIRASQLSPLWHLLVWLAVTAQK